MDSKTVVLFICVAFGIAVGQDQKDVLRKECMDLCESLTARFTVKGIFTAKAAKQEMQKICNKDSVESIELCRQFKEKAAKIASLAGSSPVKKICSSMCPVLPNPEVLVKKARCLNCKSKVLFASKIAHTLQVSLIRILDIVCPAIAKRDINSQFLCRQITRKIAISSNVAVDVASRLCSAMGKCPSGGLLGDKCALQNTTQKSSAFETTFKIMGLISDAIHPYLTHHQQKPTKPFDVLDETAKCLNDDESKPARTTRGKRRTSNCQRLCTNVVENARYKLGNIKLDMTETRKQYKQLCSTLPQPRNKKCMVVFYATDKRSILHTLFHKETCGNLACSLYTAAPKFLQCRLCSYNKNQKPIKTAVTTSLKALTQIIRNGEELCKVIKDDKCDKFMKEERKFLESLKALTEKEALCSILGLCK